MGNQSPPGPRGNLVWGNLKAYHEDALAFFSDSTKTYGDVVYFRLGPFPIYLVNHPDYIHEILVERADKFYKGRYTKELLKPLLGSGLLTNDGDTWKRQRRLAQPAFHHKRIDAYAQVMVEHAQQLLSRWQPDQECEIDQEMMKLTLGIVAKTLFNAYVSDVADLVSKNFGALQKIADAKFNSALPIPSWVPTRRNLEEKRAISELDKVIDRLISEHRASGEDNGDLLSMLLLAVDEEGSGQMTDQQIRDELMTLFLAGHETTANTLVWTWCLLAQYPDVEAKLHEELDRVLGGRVPTIQDLPQLPYTNMVVKESMRLYPPAWAFNRGPLEDVPIGDYVLKKGAMVIVSPYLIHRDGRFHDDPTRFVPERFADGYEKRLPKCAYFPFGGGPRICIGQSFALMEANLLLATIAQHYSLMIVPGQQILPDPLITLRPKYSIRAKLIRRTPVQV